MDDRRHLTEFLKRLQWTSRAYAATRDGDLFRSADAGLTWERLEVLWEEGYRPRDLQGSPLLKRLSIGNDSWLQLEATASNHPKGRHVTKLVNRALKNHSTA